ncbi:pirin family protein [Simiduia sp. 21SJ11W-1]|uniref:pirin family protein n=1 Tax=Simiduia sp. 21SJ11W-1 TaxID=2909669 RepID=UPI00209FEF7E|nr:pirin family protein [Simiduia sp. 21SJ11W-1]UTA46947.1 pirin family protein [Simiduia sp. 21SJ11W-1]
MSNTSNTLEHECNEGPGRGAVVRTLNAKGKDLGGFSVRRLLPSARQKSVGPWVFFDHMGPAEFAPGDGVNVRPHPHINLATVTYLFSGEILHRDSVGSVQPIQPGDINLMVAGSGIVHSERERPEVRNQTHELHGLQLWLALPEADEETAPAFYHYPAADLPSLELDGVRLRVMIGEAYGQRSPVKTFAQTLYIEATLKQGQSLNLPEAPERAVYMVAGEACIGATTLGEQQMAILQPGANARLKATTDCRIALVGGESVGPRYIDWNFVSSSKNRITQAKADWVAGNFAKVPGDEIEFIPLPE